MQAAPGTAPAHATGPAAIAPARTVPPVDEQAHRLAGLRRLEAEHLDGVGEAVAAELGIRELHDRELGLAVDHNRDRRVGRILFEIALAAVPELDELRR